MIRNIVKFQGLLFGLIINYRLYRKLCILVDLLYTGWISRYFKQFGNGSYIYKPINVVHPSYISIGNNCKIGYKTVLSAWIIKEGDMPNLSIGKDCNIGDYNHITCANKVILGSGVLTGRWVTITDNSHGNGLLQEINTYPDKRNIYSKGPVVIGNNVWIGDKVTILPNVNIGDGVIIGANSVVTQSIPPNSIAVGNPAKIIKIIK